LGSYGQGIAYEKVGQSEYIYGVIKSENKIVVTKIEITSVENNTSQTIFQD
jgi:hypothetical protein